MVERILYQEAVLEMGRNERANRARSCCYFCGVHNGKIFDNCTACHWELWLRRRTVNWVLMCLVGTGNSAVEEAVFFMFIEYLDSGVC